MDIHEEKTRKFLKEIERESFWFSVKIFVTIVVIASALAAVRSQFPPLNCFSLTGYCTQQEQAP